MALSSIIKVAIVGEAKGIHEAIKIANEDLDKLGKHAKTNSEKLTATAKKVTAGLAAGAIALAGVSLKNAVEGEKSHARFANAVAKSGDSVETYSKKVDGLSGHYAKLGFENDDLENALAGMIPAFGSTGKAMGKLGLAADIAKGRNISLKAASDLLVKVQTGHVSLLGRLGIATKDASGKTISQEAAMKKLSALYGGAAARSSETLAGKSAALKANFGNMTEQLGQKLIPVLLTLGEKVEKLVNFFEHNKAALIALVAVVGTFVTAMAALSIISTVTEAIGALTAANTALNLSFLASPIGLVIIAIVALVAAVVIAYKKVGWFHDAVNAAFKGIATAAQWMWNTILKPIFSAVSWYITNLLVPYFKMLWSIAKTVFSGISSAISKWWNLAQTEFNAFKFVIGIVAGYVKDRIDNIISVFRTFKSTITSVFSTIANIIKKPFELAFAAIKKAWNSTIGGKGIHIPKILGFGGADFTIPKLHSGGIFDSGQGEGLALLRDGETVLTPGQMAALASEGGRGGNVIVNLPAGVDPAAVTRAVRTYERRNGLRAA